MPRFLQQTHGNQRCELTPSVGHIPGAPWLCQAIWLTPSGRYSSHSFQCLAMSGDCANGCRAAFFKAIRCFSDWFDATSHMAPKRGRTAGTTSSILLLPFHAAKRQHPIVISLMNVPGMPALARPRRGQTAYGAISALPDQVSQEATASAKISFSLDIMPTTRHNGAGLETRSHG